MKFSFWFEYFLEYTMISGLNLVIISHFIYFLKLNLAISSNFKLIVITIIIATAIAITLSVVTAINGTKVAVVNSNANFSRSYLLEVL